MIKIQYKDNAESVGEALLIPKERREDLVFRMSLIIHDFLKPTKDGEKTFEIFSDLEQVDDEMFDDEEY